MNLKRPLWFGFSLAPLAAPLLFAIWALCFWTDPTPKQEFSGFDSYAISAWVFTFAVLTLTSYAMSFVIGTPLISTLRRFNKLSFWWVVLLAALLGAMAFVGVFFLVLAIAEEFKGTIWFELLRFMGVGGIFGFSVATLFCLLVGITDPSNREPTGA
ncbi:MAG: hypothetical protein A2X56_12090 [Nitrospirae bacterium GWC2_57_13]|jgi:magnesium-transporting ATPase (P-type)|nr:MAG: hypothetical protein A2X56_12090 [Nitrospirae bacterium GWC2_57_13]